VLYFRGTEKISSEKPVMCVEARRSLRKSGSRASITEVSPALEIADFGQIQRNQGVDSGRGHNVKGCGEDAQRSRRPYLSVR
jgi:hypothetical protein